MPCCGAMAASVPMLLHTMSQYLGRFRREAFHGLEASGYVDARIDPANVRRSGRTRQPTYEQEFKPAVVTAAAQCVIPAPMQR